MPRGIILHFTRDEVVGRALSQITAIPVPPKTAPTDGSAGGKPIGYRLEPGFNGDFDPTAPHCASWSYGERTPTADCIGFVLWSAGIDRCQPGYKGASDEWLNCTSLFADAHGRQQWGTLINDKEAQSGDFLLTMDHIGLIIRPEHEHGDHLVVDCSPRHGRGGRYERTINTGYPWSELCVVVRPKWYAPSKESAASYAMAKVVA